MVDLPESTCPITTMLMCIFSKIQKRTTDPIKSAIKFKATHLSASLDRIQLYAAHGKDKEINEVHVLAQRRDYMLNGYLSRQYKQQRVTRQTYSPSNEGQKRMKTDNGEELVSRFFLSDKPKG